MTENQQDESIHADGIEKRSLSGTLIASGAAAYGLGHLAEGVAKLKDTFGARDSNPPQPPSQPEPPRDEGREAHGDGEL
jgi:hypothetical protein